MCLPANVESLIVHTSLVSTGDVLLRKIEKRLNSCYVRDMFVLCWHTGLSYADVKKLGKTDIGKCVDGSLLILINRTKTKIPSNIPLLTKH